MKSNNYQDSQTNQKFSKTKYTPQSVRSATNSLAWVCSLYPQAFVRQALCTVLLLAGGIGVASSVPLPMPDSEVSYPGASISSAFVAMEPYVVNIQGASVTIPLWGGSRGNDFSGDAPFVSPATGKSNPAQIQAWDPVFAASFNPPLTGSYNLNGNQITNAGFPGRADKRVINGAAVTMVRYNAGDNITEGKCRSQLNAYAVPPRTHVRWDLEVAFGNADGVNDWTLTPTGASPVLFWQIHSMNQSNPPLAANIDTDSTDPTKLMITFFQRVGTQTGPKEIGRVKGIPANTLVPIVIEAFLDERAIANGGKGLLQISVNNAMVIEKVGPTLASGTKPHWWSMDMYLWNEPFPYPHTRASFWKTAKMMVFPMAIADTTPPSAPAGLAATAPDPTQVNLSWGASADNVGVAGYTVYRNGTAVGTSVSTGFTDTGVVQGTAYNYTVTAYDDADNFSAASNTAMVTTPVVEVNITSHSVENVTDASATINWTTNVPSTGVVSYGISPNDLSSQVAFGSLATGHSVQLPQLTPLTTYYYNISADTGFDTALSPTSSFTSAGM